MGWGWTLSSLVPSSLAQESAHTATGGSAVVPDWKGTGDSVSMCKLWHAVYVAVLTSGNPWLLECFVISRRLFNDTLAVCC